jgi:tRNA nucleotidyltransferase (CCA-adding enzyme)
MQIVVTHRNADFDALASQVAARKLYPDAVLVRVRQVAPPVRDFLALHKEHFELISTKEIDQQAVTRWIVVDVRRAGRLKDFQPLVTRARAGDPTLEVIVYDHHPDAEDDLVGAVQRVEPLGSTTTLLVEEILERQIPITPVEATLFALGIYSDTGSLTFRSTTPRDARVAATLLAHGASLATLAFFLRPPMSRDQRRTIGALLGECTKLDLDGVHVGVGIVPLERQVRGLSEVAHEVLSLERFEALFALFPRGTEVTVVARSQVPYIDVGNILTPLGGGGHPGAAAARLKGVEVAQVKAQLLAQLKARPFRPRLVRQMMSAPVHTVDRRTPLDRVRADFDRLNISGAPVVSEGHLSGIISRRDLRGAEQAGRMHLPVASCMATAVQTTEPQVPLLRAFEKMVEADIGRLPVVEAGHLVGIITRSDVLRLLYPDRVK